MDDTTYNFNVDIDHKNGRMIFTGNRAGYDVFIRAVEYAQEHNSFFSESSGDKLDLLILCKD